MIESDHNGIHETSEAENVVGSEPGRVVGGKKDLNMIIIDYCDDDLDDHYIHDDDCDGDDADGTSFYENMNEQNMKEI